MSLQKISNPDKLLFEGITKAQVADYYQKVSKRMLPHIQGRYLALVKCPNGIDGDCFYNKNQNEELITVSSVQELLSHVQMNTIEFHVWGSTVGNLDMPDVMVFDLDPDEGLGLKEVRQGVRDLKSVLDELNLESFLKTSGGKGYHVVVPFKPTGWEDFRNFSKSVAEVMEAKWPYRYTTNIRKQNRVGKIFIDWLRNTRGATSVAPYSLRAKKGAPVSMPIEWDELGRVAPDGVDIKRAIKRLSKPEPW
jgi:bifunctional non-homologous end joining protein LigD